MSWFTEIAGKAEDFLNRIDQNAAVALNALEEHTTNLRKPSGYSSAAETIKSDYPEDLASLAFAKERNGLQISNESIAQTPQKEPTSISSSSQSGKLGTRSRPRSKPTRDVKEEFVGTSKKDGKEDTQKPKNRESSANGLSFCGSSTQLVTSDATDDQLLEYLNAVPVKKEVDESTLLKNELTAQAREMGMLLKNHKKLQLDYDEQVRTLEILRKEISIRENELSSREEGSRQELDRVRTELMEKQKEIEQIRERLDEALEKLKTNDTLQEVQNRIEKLELENRKLVSQNVDLENKFLAMTDQLSVSEKQTQDAKEALCATEQEFAVYKEKAKAILRSKDEIIASIKNNNNNSRQDAESAVVASESQIMAEMHSLRNERELLYGEISQSRVLCESLKEENQRLLNEIQQLRTNFLELQESCSRERAVSHRIEEENLNLSQKVSALKLDLEREKSEKRKLLDAKMKATSSESDLRGSLVADGRTVSPLLADSGSDERENLKTRIKALSHALMEKQSLINNISADKQLLQIRVERLQAQIQELAEANESSHSGLTQTVVSSQPLYLSESPWDSNVTTKVKRVYSRVDSLCCQFGLAMRHRPNLRLGFSLYILMLHLWVFFILFYWSHSAMPHPYRR